MSSRSGRQAGFPTSPSRLDLTHLRIRRLQLDDTRLLFTLADGMRIHAPIAIAGP